MKTPVLMNREAVIASQNRHLDRSIYSIPYPLQITENVYLTVRNSSFDASVKESIPPTLLSVRTNVANAPKTTLFASEQVYFEKYDIKPTLLAVATQVASPPRTTVFSTKLEAKVNELTPVLHAVATQVASPPKTTLLATYLSTIQHNQLEITVKITPKNSTYEVR